MDQNTIERIAEIEREIAVLPAAAFLKRMYMVIFIIIIESLRTGSE